MTSDSEKIPPVTVCMLSNGNQEETARAVRSARRFGLPVHIGLSGGNLDLDTFKDVHIHGIPWEDDFAKARNLLSNQIEGQFVLRLDSDEVLFTFPEIDFANLKEDVFAVYWQESQFWTSRLDFRLHRNTPDVEWAGRVHERLKVHGQTILNNWGFIPGIVIRHFGYEDPEALKSKIVRNMELARSGLESGMPTYGEIITEARTEAYAGRFNPILWLKCFKHSGAQYFGPKFDLRFEPAEMLCSCGYTAPAEFLLKKNPLNIRLHLAVMGAHWRRFGSVDRERLKFLHECLSNGFFDPYYAWPKALMGMSEGDLLDFTKSSI